MKNLNELKELPEFVIDPLTGKKIYRPSHEVTRKWLTGMDECWQEFRRLHAAGHFPNISAEDLQKFIAGDSSVI